MLKVLGVVCACVCVIAAVAAGQSVPSAADRSAIARARNMYYSLQRQGVRELRCNAHPDWPQILTSMLGTNADVTARALPYLSKTNFSVVMTESSTDVTVERT